MAGMDDILLVKDLDVLGVCITVVRLLDLYFAVHTPLAERDVF